MGCTYNVTPNGLQSLSVLKTFDKQTLDARL